MKLNYLRRKLIAMKKLIRVVGETILKSRVIHKVITRITPVINLPFLIMWFVGGLLTFHMMDEFSTASYSNPVWDRIYYVWLKALLFIVFVAFYDRGTDEEKREAQTMLRPVILYSLIALLWEIISWATGMDWNDTTGTTILFLTLLCVIILYTAKTFTDQWRGK